ncbi:hypothetical protein [Roseofilum capinflatum]|uniref:HEAT repeat domain-containing protein n=1 Tax=Roseofilum capinflatum BLCC-M114 TaxID=3022440 RepID=A0ABT7B1V8_9CYAN|nr:hypothetical protein [Roseofilum capinflatum]MDJ1172807.1 hypothetical protein [Roseofilum capinflatum BLCC-M114]
MDFSEIQPVSLNSHLGQPISINNAADLSLCFNSMANVGDRVEMFFSIAENDPKTAIRSFITVIRNSTSAPIRALAIQSLGKVAQPYKQALASCESQESQELLKLLCAEVQSRKNDLTAWAALEALKEIGFSPDNIQHPEGGNLSEPLRRIQNELLDRQIAQITKIKPANTRGQTTAEYERVLEFWAYGPISELFNENLGHFNYLNLVRDVLHLTQLRGVQLGLSAYNPTVRQESFTKAQAIFRSYSQSKDKKFKTTLGETLKIRFLKEEKSEDSDLQKLTQAILLDQPIEINVDTVLLERMTIPEIEDSIELLKERCYDMSAIFASGIEVSSDSSINSFLIANKDKYLKEPQEWIERLEQKIELVKKEQCKIDYNINLFNEILNEVRYLCDQIPYHPETLYSLETKYLNLGLVPNNYSNLRKISSLIKNIKSDFICEILKIKEEINLQINKINHEEKNLSRSGCGCGLLMLAINIEIGTLIFTWIIIYIIEKLIDWIGNETVLQSTILEYLLVGLFLFMSISIPILILIFIYISEKKRIKRKHEKIDQKIDRLAEKIKPLDSIINKLNDKWQS